MGISNQSQGLKPGVCTSTTRPSSPFNGMVIYETDTKKTLVWQGSAWVMLTDADAPPGLVLIKTQTIGTNVNSVTVTDAFSSEFDSYQITVTGGVCASGDYGINVQLGSTTSGYYNAGLYLTYAGANPWNLTVSNGSFWGGFGIATSNTLSANIFLNNPYLAKNTYIEADYTYGNSAGGHGRNAGYLADSTQYTSFTLSLNSSGMTGGTIRVYGYRNTI